MIDFLRRLIQRYGFFRREPLAPGAFVTRTGTGNWHETPFYTEEKRRNERLAAIARERDALKESLKKAVKQKKARAPIYQALRALSVEELNLEAGK